MITWYGGKKQSQIKGIGSAGEKVAISNRIAGVGSIEKMVTEDYIKL